MSSSSPSPSPGSVASVALCEHVQREGLGSHIFSDITVVFQSKEYKLHRIILSQSSYFRSLFSGPWKECGKPRVELQIDDQNVTVEGLEATIAFLYGLNPTFTGDNVVGILAAGCFLCMESLCEQCVKYMVDDLREETFVTYQQLSEHNCYGQFADRIRDACWAFLCAHGARELAYVLPKLSLQLLCRLLKSDELWVVNESERYKLAKQAVLNWKLARNPSTTEGPSAKKAKSKASKKLAKHAAWQANKNQKSNKQCSREKSNKKKDAAAGQRSVCQQRDEAETALRKLQRLWGEDVSSEASKEGFDVVVDLFTGGGIIFAYMDAEEALQARNELEDANIPIDVVNDGIWQNVLLKARLKESQGPPVKAAASDDEEEEEEDDDEEEEEEEEEGEEAEDEEDDVEYDEDELESSEGWSDESGSTSSSNSGSESDEEEGSACSKRNKRLLSTLVTFPSNEPPFDGKRRKTTGGFSWAVKLDTGMQLSDFPPFRFGAEFTYRDRRWVQVAPFEGYEELDRKEVFYGGSLWKIVVNNYGFAKDEWTCTVQRRPGSNAYEGKKVAYTAKLFVKTKSGLQSAALVGGRSRDTIAMALHGNEIVKEKPLRVAAVVQLMPKSSRKISV